MRAAGRRRSDGARRLLLVVLLLVCGMLYGAGWMYVCYHCTAGSE